MKLNNADFQERFDSYEFSSFFKKDDEQYAKIKLEIWKKINQKTWELQSEDGINNPEVHGVPKNCTGRRWSR